MNKKLNTLFFVLGATLLNIIIAVLSFAILFFLYIFLVLPHMSGIDTSWVFTLIFLSSIVISIFVYRIILKILLKKIDLEKYFDPVFVKKYKKK